MKEQEKIVGVIGGMGPEATVDFMQHVIKFTKANEDNDHVRLVVDSNSKIPSRIKALYEKSGPSSSPAICDSAKRLEAYGVDFLVMPCNTAHYYYDDIINCVKIPMLNILDITVSAITNNPTSIKKVGLLATTATVKMGIYASRLEKAGIELILPDEEHQARVLSLINDIKAGKTGQESCLELKFLAEYLKNCGAQAVILGCTELGIVAKLEIDIKLVDGVTELAKATVLEVKGELKV